MKGFVRIGARRWRWTMFGDRLVLGNHDWFTSRGREKATGREFWRAQRGKTVVFLTIGAEGLEARAA